MKKATIMLLLLFTVIASAQEFEVTPNGLKNKEDKEKSYLVLKVDSTSAKELYKKTLKYLNQKYANPDKAIKSKIENEYIRVHTFIPNFTKVKNSFARVAVDGEYGIELKFKDNKVRFEIINEEFCNSSACVKYSGGAFSGYIIYNKKGKLRLPKTKQFLEDYFNSEAKELLKSINNKSEEDDW